MQDELARFEAYLRTRGLRMTRPRKTILRTFLGTEGHLSADALLRETRKVDPHIGQATVFRTIHLIAEAGLAREACNDEGARTYEHLAGHPHHDHLRCSKCGRIIEFCDPEIEQRQAAIFAQYGFEPQGHMMELTGVCPECLRTAVARRSRQ
ncbi:MAG: Fur family transcriptional regulator [Spirochaetales bacterium]|nr:Fur family transcriptional regulator [Spirochaetales bacterium]